MTFEMGNLCERYRLSLCGPLTVVLLCVSPAQAEPVSVDLRPSLTQEDALRWEAAWLPRRIGADFLNLPRELATLSPKESGWIALYTYSVLAMMLPDGNSLDTRMQLGLNTSLLPRDHSWIQVADAAIWLAVGSAWVGQWLYGWLADQPVRMQMTSLMIEAVVVAQVYHLTLKLLSGRDGPNQGDGRGRTYGPSLRALRQFPAGTPSGHATTAYAMLAVALAFVEEPWARVGLHLGAIAFSVSLVLSNYHFVSDVLAGGAMGFSVGRWVVSHRATPLVTRWHDDVTVIPFVDPWRQGAAVMFFFPSPI